MKKILILLLLFIGYFASAQTVGEFRYDTVKFRKIGGNSNVMIQNATRDTLGIYTNVGNGLGVWKRPRAVSGGIAIGNDTILVSGGGGSSYTFNSPLSETGGTVSITNADADGSTKGAASFNASDFNASSGNISIDYTNGQTANGSTKGFLIAADWTTFNSKQNAITPAALTKTDDTNVTLTLGGSPTVSLLAAASLTLGWTGTLSIARGGTNNGSLSVSNGTVYYGDGTKLVGLAPGSNGQALIINSGLPAWGTPSASLSTGTYSTMLALASPAAGQQFICTDYLEGLWIYDGVRWNWSANLVVRSSLAAPIQNGYFGMNMFTNGTGASITTTSEMDSARFQINVMKTGTTATGYVMLNGSGGIPTAGARPFTARTPAFYVTASIRFNANVSDATNRYVFLFGGVTFGTMADTSNDGSLFVTDDVNSNQWVWKPYPGIRIETTQAADLAWHKIVVKYKGTNAYLYFDGTLISSATQPGGASTQKIPTSILYLKRAGTSDRETSIVDYWTGHAWNNY